MSVTSRFVCALCVALAVFGAWVSTQTPEARVYADRTTLMVPLDINAPSPGIASTLATIREDLRIAGFEFFEFHTHHTSTSGSNVLKATQSSPHFDDPTPLGSGRHIEVSVHARPNLNTTHAEWTVSITAAYQPHVGKHPWGGVGAVVDECEARRRRIVDLIRGYAPIDPNA